MPKPTTGTIATIAGQSVIWLNWPRPGWHCAHTLGHPLDVLCLWPMPPGVQGGKSWRCPLHHPEASA